VDCSGSWTETLKCTQVPGGYGCFYCMKGILYQYHGPHDWTVVACPQNPVSNSWALKCTQDKTPTQGADWGVLAPGTYQWQVYVYKGCGCADGCAFEGLTSPFVVP